VCVCVCIYIYMFKKNENIGHIYIYICSKKMRTSDPDLRMERRNDILHRFRPDRGLF
jgi:hypothetical protein